jgi:hypothetical protein
MCVLEFIVRRDRRLDVNDGAVAHVGIDAGHLDTGGIVRRDGEVLLDRCL